MAGRLKLIEGRWFATGQREVVIGKSIHDRFAGANVGDAMDFAKGQWKVVSISMTAAPRMTPKSGAT